MEGREGDFLSAAGHNGISAGCTDRKCACMPAGFPSRCVTLSFKEDSDYRTDPAVSCCLWRAAAGEPFAALPALQSWPPCGSARWSLGPSRLSSTPSCAVEETARHLTTHDKQQLNINAMI